MATVSRVHGSNTQVGILYSMNVNLYVISVKKADTTAIDLETEDSYGVDAVVGGVIESIVDEINPLAWFTPADNSGEIFVVIFVCNCDDCLFLISDFVLLLIFVANPFAIEVLFPQVSQLDGNCLEFLWSCSP